MQIGQDNNIGLAIEMQLKYAQTICKHWFMEWHTDTHTHTDHADQHAHGPRHTDHANGWPTLVLNSQNTIPNLFKTSAQFRPDLTHSEFQAHVYSWQKTHGAFIHFTCPTKVRWSPATHLYNKRVCHHDIPSFQTRILQAWMNFLAFSSCPMLVLSP